jgi:hypothetical protein
LIHNFIFLVFDCGEVNEHLLSPGDVHSVPLIDLVLLEPPLNSLFFDLLLLLHPLSLSFRPLFFPALLVLLLPFQLLCLVLQLLNLRLDLPLLLYLEGKHPISFPLEAEDESVILLPRQDLLLSLFLSFNSLLVFSFQE